MQTVYMTIGIPGSGKSTWARNNVDDDTVIVCRDELRKMIKGKYVFDLKYEKFVERTARGMIRKALKAGFSVIVDEVGISFETRKSIVNLVSEYEEMFDEDIRIVFVCFSVNEETARLRRANAHRGFGGDYWEEVHNRMLRNYSDPHNDEHAHGIEFIDVKT